MSGGEQLDLFRYTIYLLHFDQRVRGCLHYVGITGVNNLHVRLNRHARGRGANLTRRAVVEGVGFTCVRTWPASTYQQERRLKNAGHYERLCPMCTTELELTGPAPLHFRPVPPVFSTAWRPAGWDRTAKQQEPKGQ